MLNDREHITYLLTPSHNIKDQPVIVLPDDTEQARCYDYYSLDLSHNCMSQVFFMIIQNIFHLELFPSLPIITNHSGDK